MHLDALIVAWNGIAATGVAFSVSVLPQYLLARTGARDPARIPNAADRAVATNLVRDYILAESLRLVSHATSLTLGVWSLFVPRVPNTDPVPRAAAVYGVALVCGLVVINCQTVANSIRAYLAWRRRYGATAAGKRLGVRRRRKAG